MGPSVPDAKVSPDGIFRCPVRGCEKLWLSSRPSDGRCVMIPNADGQTHMCPGCSKPYASKQLLRNHYDNHSDKQHPGRICVPSPKNLLSATVFVDYKQHMAEERRLALKRKYVSCPGFALLLCMLQSIHYAAVQ